MEESKINLDQENNLSEVFKLPLGKRCRLLTEKRVREHVRVLMSERWSAWAEHKRQHQAMEDMRLRTSDGIEDDAADRLLHDQIDRKGGKQRPIDRFRRVARLIKTLCGVNIALRQYAVRAGLQEPYVVSVATTKTDHNAEGEDPIELSFNPDDFKTKKELRLPTGIRNLLMKTSCERTEKDIQAIGRLMHSLPSFRKYTTEMQRMMCKIVRYMKCEKKRMVLRKGHIGYSVYFIYSGSVSVILDKQNDCVFSQPEVAILRRGACFGEIALVQDTRRKATIVCAEDCEFLVLEKDEFVNNGLHVQMKEEFRARVNFFRNWSPLVGWPDATVKDLSYVSRTDDYNHNRLVVKDSRDDEWLWFVVKGSCDVLRIVDPKKTEDCQTLATLQWIHSPRSRRSPDLTQRARSKSARSTSSGPRDPDRRTRQTPTQNDGKQHKLNVDYNKADISQQTMTNLPTETVTDDEVEKKPNHEDKLYFKVDVLREGQCFGMEFILNDVDSSLQQYSLVSQGCVLIQTPRNKFIEMADHSTIIKIREWSKTYPTDEELIREYMIKTQWERYKHNVVENVVSENPKTTSLQNTLQNFLMSDYLIKSEINYMTSQCYIPLTSREHSSLMDSQSMGRFENEALAKAPRVRAALISRFRRPITGVTSKPRNRIRAGFAGLRRRPKTFLPEILIDESCEHDMTGVKTEDLHEISPEKSHHLAPHFSSKLWRPGRMTRNQSSASQDSITKLANSLRISDI